VQQSESRLSSNLLATALGLGLGVACGCINGLLITVGQLQPFIVTLGTLSLFRAFALIYTNGNPIMGSPQGFRSVILGAKEDMLLIKEIVAKLKSN
jgi:ribose/xylose/arabinose/galactoside ABC-type transport system permease subunit